MILDEIVLQNVGTFAGRNKIGLTPLSDRRPIVLIGGLNGAGKTTVLECINLALYGPLGQGGGRRAGGYDNYLKNLTHRGSDPGSESVVELSFRAFQQGVEQTYRVMRAWGGTGSKERLAVNLNGVFDRSLTATWGEHVETFLPRGIAGLFFFDGEQIEALADLQKSQEVLGTALSALLGLDLVDRLTTDLSVLRRRHRVNQVPDRLKRDVEEMRAIVLKARQEEERATDAVATAQTELERAEKLNYEVSERFRTAGGELLTSRTQVEQEVETHKRALAELDGILRSEAAEAAPLLMVRQLLSDLESQVEKESTATRSATFALELEARDRAVLDMIRRSVADAGALSKVDSFLSADRETRANLGVVDSVTGLLDATETTFLLRTALPASEASLRVALERRLLHRQGLDQQERVLVAMPDPESLRELRNELDAVTSELSRKQATKTLVDENLTLARADRTKAEVKYEKELDRLAISNMAVDDDLRIVTHVDKVRATLELLRAAATRKYVGRIGDLVLEALQRLLRKETLIRSVTIDPETHAVELVGNDGAVMQASQLSAGERQLLAVSLLWGLARASGQPLPVVVDTPLGRLDGSHRERLLERYFPFASHQVVLLSTDTEIDAVAYEQIKKYVGRSFRLIFDEKTNSTTVQPGYFWENS